MRFPFDEPALVTSVSPEPVANEGDGGASGAKAAGDNAATKAKQQAMPEMALGSVRDIVCSYSVV